MVANGLPPRIEPGAEKDVNAVQKRVDCRVESTQGAEKQALRIAARKREEDETKGDSVGKQCREECKS